MLDDTAHPDAQVRVPLAMMNRHGLIAGATGTGKTQTLQLLAEQLSAAGVPVVVADLKGDLSGLAAARRRRATGSPQRAKDTGDDWTPHGVPGRVPGPGRAGHGRAGARDDDLVRADRCSRRSSDLNDTQESSLNLVFHYADKAGLPLLDLKDLRAVISLPDLSDEGKADLSALGGLSSATAGVILRDLIALADNGGDVFFGEPEWDTRRSAPARRPTGAASSPASSWPPSRTNRSCSPRS